MDIYLSVNNGAGMLITVDNANYIIESTEHGIKNGEHYVKLELRKFG